jgi:hypothetical protein
MADLILYVAQAVAAVLYAVIVEASGLRRWAEPGRVYVLATAGIAQVGLLVAARLALAPVPAQAPSAVAWWLWWLIFWSFMAAAAPIWIWQLGLQSRRIRATLAAWERWGGRNDGQS